MPEIMQKIFRWLMVIAAIAAIGIVYIAVRSSKPPSKLFVPKPLVPTSSEYRATAKNILAPFFLATANITTVTDFKNQPVGLGLVNTITTAENRLLELRVPANDKDAHLNLVLLLEKWKRVLDGSSRDFDGTIKKTNEVRRNYPWVVD